jgi:predicted Holliday junction resolvase-like endonuclease
MDLNDEEENQIREVVFLEIKTGNFNSHQA